MTGLGGLRVGAFHGLAGLEALAADWRALFDRLDRPSYVHLWEWHRSYLEARIFDPQSVLFCAAFDGDQAVAILPLVRIERRMLGLRIRLLALPLDPLTPHADILVDPRVRRGLDLAPILSALQADLEEPWDVIRLGLTAEDSIASAAVRQMRGGCSGVLVTSHQRGLSNALPIAPYEEMLARFSKNLRNNLRKSRNRLAQLGNVELRSARCPDELQEAFSRLLAVEASGWKGEAGTAIESDPRRHDLYQGFVKHLGTTGHCRIDLLMHGGHVMAGLLSVAVGDRLYAFKIGYDESYRREAPGRMLLEHVLQKLGEEPEIRYLDLISDQDWHHGWRPVRRPLLMHYLCRAAPRGALVWAAMRASAAVRARPEPRPPAAAFQGPSYDLQTTV